MWKALKPQRAWLEDKHEFVDIPRTHDRRDIHLNTTPEAPII